jgi:hypothetical protein
MRLIDNVISDARENTNPINPVAHEEEPQPEQLNAAHDQVDANLASDADKGSEATKSTRRLTQQTTSIDRLEPSLTGKSHVQAKTAQLTFESERDTQLECCVII